ncbi:MAG: chorismate synthase, partial [Parasphingopyxis sp.]
MSVNSFGHLFRFTSWGESHGPAIGAVIDGCPPGIELAEADIQPWLDRRRPGASGHTSARGEADQVRILSGVFEGRTTGAPIALQIANEDARPRDYDALADVYRPGHADFTYQAKYGLRDHRGGGRASARETAMRVAAGAVARKLLGADIRITGWLDELGGLAAGEGRIDPETVRASPLSCPDAAIEQRWAEMLEQARAAGSSLGGIVGCEASGVSAGW